MSVSAVSLIVKENFATGLAAFNASGVLYAIWSTPGDVPGVFRLWWKPHTGADGTEVPSDSLGPYNRFSAAIRSDGAVLVVYDDDLSDAPDLHAVAFNLATGAVVMAARRIGDGARPGLTALDPSEPARMSMVFLRLGGTMYVRESYDDGATWPDEQPVLNAQVIENTDLAAVKFDSRHLSVFQTARDARRLREVGTLTRTRPVSRIMRHPTLPDRYYISESAQLDVAAVHQLADNLRGGFLVKPNGNLLVPDRVRQGVADGVGDLALLDTSGLAAAVIDSLAVSTGTKIGADLVSVAAGPPLANGAVANALFGADDAAIADLARTANFGYVVGYSDTSAIVGGLTVVNLATDTPTSFYNGVTATAVAADDTFAPAVIAVGRVVGAQPEVQILTENGVAPVVVNLHKLPGRANALALAMTDAKVGRLYVATDAQILGYQIDDIAAPIRLVWREKLLTLGSCQRLVVLPSGNVLAAMGAAGVAVFAPTGEVLAQTRASGFVVDEWMPNTAYIAGNLVRPTAANPYSPQRRYFRCTVGGTSGDNEPPWAPIGLVTDAGTTWQEQGVVDGVVSDVVADSARRRVYAVGVFGGPAGVGGRVYTFDAQGLV